MNGCVHANRVTRHAGVHAVRVRVPPKAVTKQLGASIAAAESYKTYKLRKEALAIFN